MESYDKGDGSGRLRKSVSKIAFRSKEKVMRSLGMGEETKDEIIDNYVVLVTKQQAQFLKLQRDVKHYLNSINAMKTAAESFYQSLNEVYDEAWIGKDMIPSIAQANSDFYDNLHARINAEVTNALQDHLNQCNGLKVKVQKRGRKMVYYDGARRTYHTLKNAKKLEENKLGKAQDAVNQARETYETLNTQLHQELPDLHDSRVPLTTGIISTIAIAEKECYAELAEVRNKLLNMLSLVNDAYSNGDYKIQRLHSSLSQSKPSERATLPADHVIPARLPVNDDSRSESSNIYDQPPTDTDSNPPEPESGQKPVPLPRNDYVNVPIGVNGHDPEYDDKSSEASAAVTMTEEQPPSESLNSDSIIRDSTPENSVSGPPYSKDEDFADNEDNGSDLEAETNQAPMNNEPVLASSSAVNLPPVVVRREKKLNEEQDARDLKEAAKKRSSFHGFGKWVSTLTRSAKKEPVKQESNSENRSSKLFSLNMFKKEKNLDQDLEMSPSDPSNAPTTDHSTPPDSSHDLEVKSRSVFAKMSDDSDRRYSDKVSISSDDMQGDVQPRPDNDVEMNSIEGGINDDQEDAPSEDRASLDDPTQKIETNLRDHVDARSSSSDTPPADARSLSSIDTPPADARSSSSDTLADSRLSSNDTPADAEINYFDPDLDKPVPSSGNDTVEKEENNLNMEDNKNNYDATDDNNDDVDNDDKKVASFGISRQDDINLEPVSSSTDFDLRRNTSIKSVSDDSSEADVDDDSDDDDDDDDELSSYHSSLIDSLRSSVSLSCDELEVDAGKIQVERRKLSFELQREAEANAAFGGNPETTEIKLEPLDKTETAQTKGEYPLSDDDLSSDGEMYASVKPRDFNAQLHSSAVTHSDEIEDDYEDTVTDTIIFTSGTSVTDDQPVYEDPASLDQTSTEEHEQNVTDNAQPAQVILPPHFLCTVEAMYPYQGSDDDELSFNKGDVIYVVEYPDPEEQDEGWQMGVLKSSWEDTQSTVGMAVFPANFTKKL